MSLFSLLEMSLPPFEELPQQKRIPLVFRKKEIRRFYKFRVVVQSHPSDFAHGRPPIFCRTGKLPRAPKKLGRLRVVVGLVSASGLAFA